MFSSFPAISPARDVALLKLRKTVTDNTKSPSIITTTNYLNGFVYESKSTVDNGTEALQLMSHEEGRFRPQTNQDATQPIVWVADYFIKDHLGNVRMTLTEETQITEHLRATLEDNVLLQEGKYFNNLVAVDKQIEAPLFDNVTENEKIDKVNATTSQTVTGMGILLKVTAGDKIKAGVFAHYTNNEISTTPDDTKTVAQQLLNGINTSFANQLGTKGQELIKNNGGNYLDGILGFLNGKNNETPNEDGVIAHLNWMR